MTDEQEMNRGMATLKIIWMAMLLSLAAYLAVGLVAAPGVRTAMSAKAVAVLRTALYAVGIVTLAAVGFVRRMVLGQGARTVDAAQSPRRIEPQRYLSAVIVSLGMCESVGIYGLILYLLGKNSLDLYLLLGAAAAAMYFYRPKGEDLAG